MLHRLMQNWVYGGFLAGLLLLLLLPVIGAGWSLALTVTFLQLPIYMLHQYEEHDDDRFRRMANQVFGKGREVLPTAAVFVINIVGVWGLNALSFSLAASVGVGWGLIGVYTTLVNVVLHVVQAIIMRSYNPGLATALVLLLPAGIAGAWIINATGIVSTTQQITAIAIAVLSHVAIRAYIAGNARRLSPGPAA